MSLFLSLALTSMGAKAIAQSGEATTGHPTKSTQVEISRALSSGPANVTRDATVAEMDDAGNLKVLCHGSNEFTCVPGNPKVLGKPAYCADKAAMQWNMDRIQHKPRPTIREPGIEYMLAGAVVKNGTDPNRPPIHVPLHWMILWPFDVANSGLSMSRKTAGAYIMLSGTPWAHIHVMGAP
ncbi:MAG TPA: hypothetical protein VGG18_08015 [Granulicella sp.]|jgi:hypothetical protein